MRYCRHSDSRYIALIPVQDSSVPKLWTAAGVPESAQTRRLGGIVETSARDESLDKLSVRSRSSGSRGYDSAQGRQTGPPMGRMNMSPWQMGIVEVNRL